MNTTTVNKAHSIWSVLPAGYADAARTKLKLSLVVSLRAQTVNGRLDDMLELLDWPAQLQSLDSVSLFVEGQPGIVQAKVTSAKPNSALWRTLFPASTPVRLEGSGDINDIDTVASSVATKPLVEALRGIYAGAATGARGRGSALDRAVAGLAQWSFAPPSSSNVRSANAGSAFARAIVAAANPSLQAQVADLLDPTTMTAASVARAADLLRAQRLDDAAAAAPLVPVIRRLRSMIRRAPAAAARAGGTGPDSPPTIPTDDGPGTSLAPGQLDNTRTADQADFHQVLGLVSAQPLLALALGVQFDLEVPAFAGPKTIRVTGGLPLLIANGAPWSKVIADPNSGRFTMASEPGAPSEVRNGMLDLRASGPGADKYVLTTMDLVGTTAQLAGMAGARAPGLGPVNPPPRRNVGITLAQVDRRETTVKHTLARGKLLASSFGEPQGFDPNTRLVEAKPSANSGPASVGPGEVVLHADDVTTGYRVDVRANGGPWRSLMRRQASYTIGRDRGAAVINADREGFDEGAVDAMQAVQQRDGEGTPHLEIGEALWTWDGWGLATRRPGTSVTAATNGDVTTELVPPEVSKNHPLRMEIAPKRGTLERLRYGRTYEFRVRTVDLAGHSIAPDLADPELVSQPLRYRRLDPLPAPDFVLRAPLTAGESSDRIVVRSTGNGEPISGSERHVAPPRAWQHLAELHGHFDAAFGADDPQRATERRRLLAIGSLEGGSFTDTMVPDPANPTLKIPALGIRVAVNEDSAHAPTGSLDKLVRGQALPPGEYVVHDTNTLNLPYLPDPLALGMALNGLPTPSGEVVTARYAGSSWPSIQPLRLIAKPGTGASGASVAIGNIDGRPTLTITVPPASEFVTTLSSTLSPAGLALMEIDLPPGLDQAALAGQNPLLTPGREVRFVHAVRRPLLPLAMHSAAADKGRILGSTMVSISGSTQCHPASTARLDIETRWEEVVDDGTSPVRFEKRSATVGSVTVLPGQQNVPWKATQTFGDGKRRDLDCHAIASTRFREYFPAKTPPDQLVRVTEQGAKTIAINTTRPDPVEVHSVVPTFRWTRHVTNGVLTSRRDTAGVRVWLARPWQQTGNGERLGVVIYRDKESADAAENAEDKETSQLHATTTRWCGDPLDGFGHKGAHLVAANFPARKEVDQNMPPQKIRPFPNATLVDVRRDVIGHEVHYDAERDLWFCDIDIEIIDQKKYFPFVRLGLVRHQPESAPGCHFSPIVVTDPLQLPPQRTMQAMIIAPNRVALQIVGPWINNSVFAVDVHSRAEDPMLGFEDGVDAVLSGAHGNTRVLTTKIEGDAINVSGTVDIKINGVPSDAAVARLVLREYQVGESLYDADTVPSAQPLGAARRAVYVDTIDQAMLGAGV